MAINDFKVRHGIVVGPDDFSVDVSTDTATFADGYVVNIGTDRVLKQTDNISELTNDSGYLVSKADVDALGVDAGTLDSINSSSFVRTDQDNTITAKHTIIGTGELLTLGNGLLDSADAWIGFGNGATSVSWQIRYQGSTSGPDGNELQFLSTSTSNGFQLDHLGTIETVGAGVWTGNGSGLNSVNATTLDSIDSSQFLRSDQDDIMDGNYSINGNLTVNGVANIYGNFINFVTGTDTDARIEVTDENPDGAGGEFIFWGDGVAKNAKVYAKVYEGDKIKILSTDYQNAARNEGVTVEYNALSKSLDYNFF